jgi:D-3-phosphoglycerate dehydrogenase
MSAVPPAVFVGPTPVEEFDQAVLAGGCRLSPSLEGADAVVWFGRDPAALQGRLPERVRWLQLPDAGVEKWVRAGVVTSALTVTSARGVYGPQVAEHALALVLACVHGVPVFARARAWDPAATAVATLRRATVVVVGAGGIGSALIDLLRPFGADVVAVTPDGRAVEGALRSIAFHDLPAVLPEADVVVLAAPSTPETRHLMRDATFALMKPSAVVVNVARGDLIDTDALVSALDAGTIAMAALDVTEPEPLADDHRLLTHPRALITPHVANPPHMKRSAFAQRVLDNCSRFADGRPLLAIVDIDKGY